MSENNLHQLRFDEERIEYFAKREHGDWLKLKLNFGYGYLQLDDIEKPEIKDRTINLANNPNLVSWEHLDKNIKKANKNTFINLPKMCEDSNVGLKIVKSE